MKVGVSEVNREDIGSTTGGEPIMSRYFLSVIAAVLMVLFFYLPCRGGDLEDLANCIMGDDFARVKNMISRAPDLINRKGTGGWYPLHYAAAMNRKRSLLLLIKGGANLSARDDELWTPLHLAAYQGHQEMALILISRGAEIDARDRDGWTPLLCALNSYRDEGFSEIARALIERGADVNARTGEGKTPLLLALERGREEMAALLRQKGARE